MSLKRNSNKGKAVGRSGTVKNQSNIKRVEDIILNDSHPAYRTPSDIGIIFFTEVGFNQEITNPTALPTARPININNVQYPTIGALVPITEGPSDKFYSDIGGNISNKTLYYGTPINVHNTTTNNALPTPKRAKRSKPKRGSDIGNEPQEFQIGKYIKEKPNLSPLLPGEGDMINEGTHGQRLHFLVTGPEGTNILSNGATSDPNDGNSTIGKDKAIIMSLGEGSQENITNDAASIYLVEKHGVPLDAASMIIDSHKSTYQAPLTPMELITRKPPQPIPNAIDDAELIIEPMVFDGTAQDEVVTPTESTGSVDPDPVFAALDEAEEAGLLIVEDFEDNEVSGTDDQSEETGEIDPSEDEVGYDEPETDPDADPFETEPEEEEDSGTKFDAQKIIDNLDPNTKGSRSWRLKNYKKMNLEAHNAWRKGDYSEPVFSNQSGKIMVLNPPDKKMTMEKTTKRDIKYIVLHTTGGWRDTKDPATQMYSFLTTKDLPAGYTNTIKDLEDAGIEKNFEDYPTTGYCWIKGGYHWLIPHTGIPTRCYPDSFPTWGGGDNPHSIHLNWMGGVAPSGYKAKTLAKKLNISRGEAYEVLYGFGDIDFNNRTFTGHTGKYKQYANPNLPKFEQLFTLLRLAKKYSALYPDAVIIGHNQVNGKPCPLFDVATVCRELRIGKTTEPMESVYNSSVHSYTDWVINNSYTIVNALNAAGSQNATATL